MTLSEETRERLADVVALQPTKNAELQERWGLESGSEVHGYLESELGDYYYRDDNSLIRATDEAAELVDVEPGVTGEDEDGHPERARLDELEARAFRVLVGPDERSESVVSVLQKIRSTFDVDPEAEAVRKALRSLVRSNLAETEKRTVPTFRRTVSVDEVSITVDGNPVDTRSDDNGSEDIREDIEEELAETVGQDDE